MVDLYNSSSERSLGDSYPQITAPARNAIAVTVSDSHDVTNALGDKAPCYAKALYVGSAGDITVVTAGDRSNSGQGTPVTFSSVPIGWFPVQVRRIMATGTVASNIVGLYDL